ncbi:MAG: thioredoxin domain-containing protein [Candidatus Eremiobacteraeota bacterium]|nr:thioredoxin domain-containing protein [Candidatus Eremiobacteraeota bacterium]
MSEFRFSPRTNRAHEIGWMAWGPDAFARAHSEDKPILLSISAVWCHWCHVMDETTYSDESVIDTINRRFVPVRVDNDKRPDINARYNMGGWPTTAFLAPDGTTLTGATYLPPQQMRQALDQIANFYSEQKGRIAERVPELQMRRGVPAAPADGVLDDAPIAAVVDDLVAGYDQEHGGFGDAPKFPQADVAEFLLTQWRYTGDRRLYDIVAHTMLAMSRGGMYDHVEGGFFRYSTTRDWSVPHFEKMAEDHAGLLRVLSMLTLFAPAKDFHEALRSTVHYVRRVLYDPTTSFFAGSQDADERYYELPLEERRAREAPYVDRTSYTNWTCALAGALGWASLALDDDALLALSLRTLDNVHDRLDDDAGLLFHVLAPGNRPDVSGLLTDQVAYARALLDAHEISGQPRFLTRARALADATIARFAADGGGFYDRAATEEPLGRLAIPDRPVVDNGLFADALLRLSALTNVDAYRQAARTTLAACEGSSRGAGSFAASYCRALQRYLAPEITVRIIGDAASTNDFREAAIRLPSPFTSIRTIPPDRAHELDLPPDPQPAAYVCASQTCSAPVRNAGSLRDGYDAVTVARSERSYQR